MRTEEEVLKDLKKLKWKIYTDNDFFIHLRWFGKRPLLIEKNIRIYKKIKTYCTDEITMKEHKLLNELFTIWGWL